MKDNNLRKLILAALFLALGIVLPFITLQIPTIGQMLSPMHIPVLLCGVICGWKYGLIVGFICPLLRGIMFGMPALVPSGIAMAFELATYGIVIGVVYRALPKKKWAIYPALFSAMICGRIVWGLARFIIAQAMGVEFTIKMFIAGAFTTAIPGIIVQIILIPVIVIACERTMLNENSLS